MGSSQLQSTTASYGQWRQILLIQLTGHYPTLYWAVLPKHHLYMQLHDRNQECSQEIRSHDHWNTRPLHLCDHSGYMCLSYCTRSKYIIYITFLLFFPSHVYSLSHLSYPLSHLSYPLSHLSHSVITCMVFSSSPDNTSL